jgi:NADH:ubiquinone oxidoreductase subunit E
MPTPSPSNNSHREQVFIDKLIGSRRGRPRALLGILEAAQERNRYNYLPLETVRQIATEMEMPLSRIYSVATFYALFNLQPRARTRTAFAEARACQYARLAQPPPMSAA